ncbi:proteic killer suppression protein [Peptoniphilus olsenii]|uniref:Proteic killer suppression protein n=1 Tax=Peptoniphilus olsenii TaxID=411570 RepID=A0ABV2JA05_9FIRM
MQISYDNNKIKKLCTDYKFAKKNYIEKIAKKLYQAINFIENAENLKSVMEYRPFYFHDLKGDRSGQYAIDIGSRKDGYRLIILLEKPKDEVFNNAINITEVIFKEMGKHYE